MYWPFHFARCHLFSLAPEWERGHTASGRDWCSVWGHRILPTGRAARYTGGLWVGKFLKTVTYQRMTPAASRRTGEVTEQQCHAEHMLAHGLTARIRVERYREVKDIPPTADDLDAIPRP